MKCNIALKIKEYLTICLIILFVSTVVIIWKLEIENKNLGIVFLALMILIDIFLLRQSHRDGKAYQNSEGMVLEEPVLKGNMICSIIAILCIGVYIYEVWQGKNAFGLLALLFLLLNGDILQQNHEMIIIEKKRMYFSHQWIAYENIRKIDSDQSFKRYVVIYIFGKKNITKRVSRDTFERFTTYIPVENS